MLRLAGGVPGGAECADVGDSGEAGGYAQVAEWLMAADCKSAGLWTYGGSNPPLCTMICEAGFAGLDLQGWICKADLRGCNAH